MNNKQTTMMVNRRAVALGVAAVLSASGVGIIASTAQASGGGTDHQVTFCHRRNSETNPYGPKPIPTDKAAVFSKGHDGHTGPVFQPGMKADKDEWGDIIPPFVYVDNKGVTQHYDGMNWTTQGQAILANGCQVPNTTPSTTPPSTTTATPPPVTSTSTPPPTTTTSTSPSPTTSTSSPSTTTTAVENPSGDAGFGVFCDTENNGGKVSFGGDVYNFNDKQVKALVSTDYGSTDVIVAPQDRAMVKIKTNVYEIPSGSATVTLTWADGSPGSTTFESSYDGVKCAATPPPTTTPSTTPAPTTTTTATPSPVTSTTTAVVTPPATTTSTHVPSSTKTVKVVVVKTHTTGSTPQNGSIPVAAHTGSIGEDNSGRMFGGIAALVAAFFLGLWSLGVPTKFVAARATRRH